MSRMKRAFPMPIWLAAYLMAALACLGALWFLAPGEVKAFSPADIASLLKLDAGRLQSLIPSLETALSISIGCLLIGYPAGYVLGRSRRRTAKMLWLMTPLWLLGGVLLFAAQWMDLLPQSIRSFLSPIEYWGLHFPAGQVLILFPLMLLPAATGFLTVDTALTETARDLGASRVRAFLTLTFPRTLPGTIAGFSLVFLLAAGFSLIEAPDPSFGFIMSAGAVLIALAFLLLLFYWLFQRKTRRPN
jgi:ABC-type spermidine/putrescine transport system permease subunit I